MLVLKDVNYMYSMKICLYIFHENNFQTLEIICLISTMCINISLKSLRSENHTPPPPPHYYWLNRSEPA